MPSPIDPDTRAAILADIQAGKDSCRAIADRHRVSPSTVSKIAKDAGLANAFERAQTKNATEALKADMRARRAALSSRLLDKAGELLDAMDQPAIVFNIGGKDNVYTEHEMPKPPTADLRNLMVTAATAIDKHHVLEKIDHETGDDGARSLLADLGAAFTEAATRLGGDDEPPSGDPAPLP